MSPERLLEFWFADSTTSVTAARERIAIWFGTHPEFDRAIETEFGDLPARARNGKLQAWLATPRTALALVLVLDQFPRNLYRRTAQAFAFDPAAREATNSALAAGHETALHPLEAAFLFLPFEHAEDLNHQRLCREGYLRQQVRAAPDWRELFNDFLKAADEHRQMVESFGRFPHRNRALGRQSTPAEMAFLAAGAKTYGQLPEDVA